ncbi:unnamed protein product [Lasius platythorax]|uniref:Uncharacterized protein n=1 Tax=Lasius platythorax TaxID=488582 RepID=A0AAV2N5L8_9HYME
MSIAMSQNSSISTDFSSRARQEKNRESLNFEPRRVLQVVAVDVSARNRCIRFIVPRCPVGGPLSCPQDTLCPRYYHIASASITRVHTRRRVTSDLRCIARRDSVSSQGPCIKDRGTVTSNLPKGHRSRRP